MSRVPDSRRRARPAPPKPGLRILRALAPGVYGAALLGGVFSTRQSLHPLALAGLAGFIGYFLWRIHALVVRAHDSEPERVELGLLAVLALATAVEIVAPPPVWATAAYGVLLVGLAAAVPLPGILALPLAAAVPWTPWSEWATRTVNLELLALAAGLLAWVERGRRRKLQLALSKIDLDTEHLDAQNRTGGDRRRSPLAQLDAVLYAYLTEVKTDAGAHAAVLAVTLPSGGLYMREMVSDSHAIRGEGVLDLKGTAFQWILENRKPLSIHSIRDPASRLGYYAGRVPVRSFLGVPLLEGDQVKGVLAVDSLAEHAFTETHQGMLRSAANQGATLLSQIQQLERVRREARDFEHLYEFSKRLGTCDAVPDLLDLLLAAVGERISPEFCAVALLDTAGQLTLSAVGGPRRSELVGRTFPPHDGLAGWVLSSRQYLHYAEGRERARRPLFTRDVKVDDFQSLLLHPLETHGASLGVLCVASGLPRSFDPPAVKFCEVLAQQGAQGLLQLRTLEQLRALAATDGLTGLANRRVFMERTREEIARCHRYDQPLSLLLLDVDFFKKINDRHGHPAGDEVLRQVATTLAELARETDLVGRYGGEEFAVLLPSTEDAGAAALAERMRAGIAALEIRWEKHSVPVRVSVGRASLRSRDKEPDPLLSRADQALYAAKERGRNRVVSFDEIEEYLTPEP
jgi:diguanylate cyclase (GGDEF)-like protein